MDEEMAVKRTSIDEGKGVPQPRLIAPKVSGSGQNRAGERNTGGGKVNVEAPAL